MSVVDDGLEGMSARALDGWVSLEVFNVPFDDPYPVPHYTTDPRASAELRREMERRGFDWQVGGHPAFGGTRFSAAFLGGRKQASARASTEERTIAIAALRAVRASKGEGR